MIIHEVKLLPKYFKEVISGNKAFELRKNDRDYKEGDYILLKEYNPQAEYEVAGIKSNYTGRKILKRIGYILDDLSMIGKGENIKDYIIFSLIDLDTVLELTWNDEIIDERKTIYNSILDKDLKSYSAKGSDSNGIFSAPFMNKNGADRKSVV